MCGENPWVTAYGMSALRIDRSSARITSRCDRWRSRPSLPNRTRRRKVVRSATGRTPQRDVEAEVVARVAAGASVEAAVLGRHSFERTPPLLEQVALRDAGGDVVPRECGLRVASGGRQRHGVDPRGLERRHPAGERELLGPRIEDAAVAPSVLDHICLLSTSEAAAE